MNGTMNRRGFVSGAAVAAGTAAFAGATGVAFADDSMAPANHQVADIVVVGEGMGGLATGVRALQNGVQNVTIVEVSKWIGGGSSFCAGAVHAYGMGKTREDYLQNTRFQSASDLALSSFLATEGFMNWLVDLGLPVEMREASDEDVIYGGSAADLPSLWFVGNDGGYGVTACEDFFVAFENLFVEMGGTVLHGVSGRHVIMDGDGHVSGIACVDADGNELVIDTTQVVLATGGWQNDDELKSRFLGRDAWQAGVMGVPYNTGSGLKMAVECGASLQGDFANFAGNFLPARPAKNWMEDVENYETAGYNAEQGGKWWFNRTLLSIPAHAILVNSDGKRFCDEGRFRHSFEGSIAQQKRATAHVICDAATWNDYLSADELEFLTSDAIGAAYFMGATIEELADAMNASGIDTYEVHKGNLVKTVAEYNEAATAGDGTVLDPVRAARPCVAIEEGPFYALPIRNAIFCTYGGVAIDEEARVLDGTHRPIAGLYATSPCAGGMMHEFYAGSIAHAGVTGLWAADAAAVALSA